MFILSLLCYAVLVLQSSRCGRESWLLYFNCLPVVWRLVCSVALPRGAMGRSAVCGRGISLIYSLTFDCIFLRL